MIEILNIIQDLDIIRIFIHNIVTFRTINIPHTNTTYNSLKCTFYQRNFFTFRFELWHTRIRYELGLWGQHPVLHMPPTVELA